MNRPFRREVGRAFTLTRAGRLADARESLRRLARAEDRQRWTLRREREIARSQLWLPVEVEGREGGGYPHQAKVLGAHPDGAGATRRDKGLG